MNTTLRRTTWNQVSRAILLYPHPSPCPELAQLSAWRERLGLRRPSWGQRKVERVTKDPASKRVAGATGFCLTALATLSSDRTGIIWILKVTENNRARGGGWVGWFAVSMIPRMCTAGGFSLGREEEEQSVHPVPPF